MSNFFAVLMLSLVLSAVSPLAYSQTPALHSDIASAYADDDVGVIVKGTSAAAMVKACPGDVKVKPLYAASLASVLDSNDAMFGPGTTDADIAKKVDEHKREKDCKTLTRALVRGLYKNVFLTAVK